MTQNHNLIFGKPWLSAILLGVVGGNALVITVISTTNGPAIYLPYMLLMLAVIPAHNLYQSHTFKNRFIFGMITFMSATTILYLYIVIIVNPDGTSQWISQLSILQNIWEHTWRLGLMTCIGAIASAVVAQLSVPKQKGINTVSGS